MREGLKLLWRWGQGPSCADEPPVASLRTCNQTRTFAAGSIPRVSGSSWCRVAGVVCGLHHLPATRLGGPTFRQFFLGQTVGAS
jgi:hypothetical protein